MFFELWKRLEAFYGGAGMQFPCVIYDLIPINEHPIIQNPFGFTGAVQSVLHTVNKISYSYLTFISDLGA